MTFNPKTLLAACITVISGIGIVTAQNRVPYCPQADGPIHAITVSGDTVFIGGEFSRLYSQNYQSNYGTVLSAPNNVILPQWVKPNGTVYSVVPDGHKGFYIGGSFDMVGNESRPGLAHIDSLGEVSERFSDIAADNKVKTLSILNDTLYAGGEFTRVGMFTHSYGAIVGYDEKLKSITQYVDGVVYCAVPDGSGGWFIGGNFTKVGHYNRNRIAHIDNTGLVSAWDPSPDGDVYTLLLYNGKLYVGGSFLNIGSQSRSFLAELSTITGSASSWNTDVNNAVYSMSISGTTLFLGGSFNQVGGKSRNSLASVDISSAAVTNWNPNSNNVVNAIVVSDTLVYVGGYFTSIGGQSRNYLAAIGITGGKATGWNPSPSNAINAMVLSGNDLYVAGKFTQINFKSRNFLACLDKTTGSVSTWNPDPDNVVNCIYISGNSMYVGGEFSKISGTDQKYVAQLDISTASIISWDPNPDGPVNCICPTSYGIFVGGDFQVIGGKTRNYLACFILDRDKKLTIANWNPNVDAPVHAVVADALAVYAGGDFTIANGLVRTYIASFEKKRGDVSVWKPMVNGPVRSLALKDYTIYAGGDFDTVEGFGYDHIVAINKSIGIPGSWAPSMDGSVTALLVTDSIVYAGGDFRMAGDSSREHIAAIERSGQGKVISWNPGTDSMGTVYSFLIWNDTLIYAGGLFNAMGGEQRNCLSLINRISGKTFFAPNTNNTVYTLGISGNNLFVGGDYTVIGEVYRNGLGAFRASTGDILDWNPPVKVSNDPYVPGRIYCLATDGLNIFIGGLFDTIGMVQRLNIAQINRYTGAATSWSPQSDGAVKAIVLADSMLYVGGSFGYISGKDKFKVAALNKYTGSAYTWDLYSDGDVNSIVVRDSLVYLGGRFSFIGNAFRNRLAAINRTTGMANVWNPNVGGLDVKSIEVMDSLLYAGGDFDYINTNAHSNLASISLLTGKAKDWTYDASGVVNDLLVKDNVLYIGGDFVAINTKTRNKLAAIDLKSGNLKEWKPNALYSVHTLAGYGTDKIFFGGDFTAVLTEPVYRLAEVDTGSVTCNLAAHIAYSGSTQFCDGDTLVLHTNGDLYSYTWFRNDTLIASVSDSNLYVTTGGNYSVVIKDSLGCADTSSSTRVTVYPKPSQNPVTGDDHVFCSYTYSYRVEKHSGSVYQWSVNGGNIASGSGTDSIAVTWSFNPGAGWIKMVEINANGCVGDTQLMDVILDTVYLIIQPQQLDYTVTGESKQITINSNLDWTVSTDGPSWVSLSKTTGTGNDIIDVAVNANTAHTARIATVTFSAKDLHRQVTIHQDSVPDIEELSLNKDSIFSAPNANKVLVKLHSNTSWNVTNNASWLTVNPMSGLGDTTLEVNITENTTPVMRSTNLKVATSKLTASLYVEQAFNVGLLNLETESAFLLYPNPSKGKITFQNQTSAETTVFIYDMNGRQKDHFSVSANERKELDYMDFTPGMYMAQISSGEAKKRLKFIIIK